MSNSNLTSDTNSPMKESFWRFSSRKVHCLYIFLKDYIKNTECSPGTAKPINNHLPHKFEKFNGFIPKSKRENDQSAIFNHNQYVSPKIVQSDSTSVVVDFNSNNSNSNNNSNNNINSTPDSNSPKSFSSSSLTPNNKNHLSLSSSSINSLGSSGGGIDNNNNNNNNNRSNVYDEKSTKLKRFEKLLCAGNVDLEALKKLAWRGIREANRTRQEDTQADPDGRAAHQSVGSALPAAVDPRDTGAHFIYLGNTSSLDWLRAGNQRFGDAIHLCFSFRVCGGH
ncbi:TBC domain protein [Heterostelium album PN500]|uniref:TBC domain protein n=1 Tax=Heterostelium pallidum (strain ATCC 26659 / Pp 5 / PN500) TaxID=670386 RepID=D3AVX8_HETP5|nr:TBC domain protein [Heterostelium album PN500]EFA86451.1 TBC domain protein [Heterostelium album PN500]|eukprot:XP_020438556.1 TBC domain protein [Heterostelium album PN500]